VAIFVSSELCNAEKLKERKNLKLIQAKFQSVHQNNVLINLQVKYQAI